jgi:putative hydrolase of the HAD superfamily
MTIEPTQDSNTAVVFVDADNTLWDTNEVFAVAQLGLLSNVEKVVGATASTDDRLGFVRQLDPTRHSLS